MTAPVEFKIELVGENRLITRFGELPDKVKAAVKVKITELTKRLLTQVQAREPVRTGRLRSQTHAYIDESKDPNNAWVRGRVRILPVTSGRNRTAAAFGALEYGSPGKSGRRTGLVRVRWYSRRGIGVGTYERRPPTIAARRFLRGPAAAMFPRARQQLEEAINRALKG